MGRKWKITLIEYKQSSINNKFTLKDDSASKRVRQLTKNPGIT